VNIKRLLITTCSVALAAIVVGIGIYALVVLRTCDQQSDVTRNSASYALCGISDEFIATVPLLGSQDARYSWQRADGNKPGRTWVKFSSRTSGQRSRAELSAFLQQHRFVKDGTDGDYELWSDGKTVTGFAIHAGEDPAVTVVEFVHNTGLD
jgi:hypothetical protein